MISLLLEVLLICAIVVLGCYILDNLVIALIVCGVIVAFLSRKKPKKKEEWHTLEKPQHEICKEKLHEMFKKEKTDEHV